MNFRLNDSDMTRYTYEESGVFAIPGQDTTTTTTDTTDHSTAHETGNSIGGQYAAATSGSVHSVTITQESNVLCGPDRHDHHHQRRINSELRINSINSGDTDLISR